MMWLIIFAVIVLFMAVGIAYLTASVGKFGLIRQAAGDSKKKRILISLVVIAVIFGAAALIMSLVNAVVILIFSFLFFLIFGVIGSIAEKAGAKRPAVNWPGWLAILATVLYFAAGYYLCNNVWQTDYRLTSQKDTGHLKIAMFADSHIGTTFDGKGFEAELKKIEKQSADILLIPGDYVDDWTSKDDAETACKALGKTKFRYGVWFAFGNHDKGMFRAREFSGNELTEMLKNNGVHVLDDTYQLVEDRFYVAGRLDKTMSNRKSMDELLKGVDTSKYIIVLDHEPNAYDEEAASAADLVVSGHTHGGQLFPINDIGILTGANDKTYGYERRNGTDFIVTSGISDWALLFKTGTKSEYVIIDVEQKNK